MRTLYLECMMGAAGDMLMSALYEICPDPEGFLKTINALGLPQVSVTPERAEKCGVMGTHMKVEIEGFEEQSADAHGGKAPAIDIHLTHGLKGDLPSVRRVIGDMPLSQRVKDDVIAIYEAIGQAEAKAHGMPMEQVHFHEVGTIDAVVDIVGVSLLMEQLNPDRVTASPVHVGAGAVNCAHGVLPVPTPATAYLLRGIPTFGRKIQGELCTPTGAAILKHFVDKFGPQPDMITDAIGYGMGKKDFSRANCVRAFWGESCGRAGGEITELRCNIDDMTGEALAFACERLMESGARDVYCAPIFMKKGRPAQLLTVLCLPEQADRMAEELLRYTTTLGVRRIDCSRYEMNREVKTRRTVSGPVRFKCAEGYGITKEKPEYEDVAKLAQQAGWGLQQIDLTEEE